MKKKTQNKSMNKQLQQHTEIKERTNKRGKSNEKLKMINIPFSFNFSAEQRNSTGVCVCRRVNVSCAIV